MTKNLPETLTELLVALFILYVIYEVAYQLSGSTPGFSTIAAAVVTGAAGIVYAWIRRQGG